MASSKLFFIYSLLLTCIPTSFGTLIDDICSKPTSPEACKGILNSDPNIVNAQRDVTTFGYAVLNKAIVTTTSAQTSLASLGNKETNPKVKASIATCATIFGSTISKFNNGKNFLQKKDRNGLNAQGLGAINDANSCTRNFGGLVEPVIVQIDVANVELMANIVVALSNIV